MIREAATYVLVLQTFLPLSMERVSVHVEKQEIRGFTSYEECKRYKIEAKHFVDANKKVKANCLKEAR